MALQLQAPRPPLLEIGLLALVVVVLYLGALVDLANVWTTDPFFTHGLLVPPLVLGLAYHRRSAILALPRSRDTRGLTVVLAALALLFVGRTRDDIFAQEVSLLVLIGGLCLTLHGLARTRAVAGSLLLLVFALPYPWLGTVGPALQGVAASLASGLLQAVSIPIERDVFTIVAKGIPFEVAPLCSGLSSIVSLAFVSYVACYTMGLQAVWVGGLTAVAVPLAIVANAVRVTSVIFIGVNFGVAEATGFLHGASDLLVYLLALVPILGLAVQQRRARLG